MNDTALWLLSGSELCSCKSSYNHIYNKRTNLPSNSRSWGWIWKATILSKLKNFLWLLNHNCLPTKVTLTNKGINISPYGITSRSMSNISSLTAIRLTLFGGNWYNNTMVMLISPSIVSPPLTGKTPENCSITPSLTIILTGLLFYLFSFRLFGLPGTKISLTTNVVPHPSRKPTEAVEFFHISILSNCNPHITISIRWSPPNMNAYKLNIDVACLGNPGKRGIGGEVRTLQETGWWVSCKASTIPLITSWSSWLLGRASLLFWSTICALWRLI